MLLKLIAVVVVSICLTLSNITASTAEDKKDALKQSKPKAEANAEDKSNSKPSKDDKAKKYKSTATKGGLIDINTASKDELKTIPGIEESYADKIIANRPYKKKDQLKSKNILPAHVYESIKDKIVAKQPAK